MADRFKNVFSHEDVKVHLVGAWYVMVALPLYLSILVLMKDTVSSIGFTCGNIHVANNLWNETCLQALALDEQWVKFIPEYAYGGAAKPPRSAESEEEAKPAPTLRFSYN